MVRTPKIFVTPRVVSPWTGQQLELGDVVREWVDDGGKGALILLGSEGAGKSSALDYLRRHEVGQGLRLLDDPDELPDRCALTVATAYEPLDVSASSPRLKYQLAGWDMDTVLEWLLAHDKERCASVMARIQTSGDIDWLAGNPAVVSGALQRMCDEESVPGAVTAVRQVWEGRLPLSGRHELEDQVMRRELIADRSRGEWLWRWRRGHIMRVSSQSEREGAPAVIRRIVAVSAYLRHLLELDDHAIVQPIRSDVLDLAVLLRERVLQAQDVIRWSDASAWREGATSRGCDLRELRSRCLQHPQPDGRAWTT